MSEVYKADGVDVEAGDDFSSFAGIMSRDTYLCSPFVKIYDYSRGHFRGLRPFSFQNLPDGYTVYATVDGIGTKVILIDVAYSHHEAARDLLAMTCGDITRFGGLPLVFINILDVNTLGKYGESVNNCLRRLMTGLRDAAKEQKIVVIGGETAELGDCVGSENPEAIVKFNWGGTVIGVYHTDKLITGDTLAPGQVIVAMKENGFRSNGISSVRKALRMKFGDRWFTNLGAKEAIKSAAVPSVLYDRFLADINGWYSSDFTPKIRVHLVAHITGGSIRSKLGEDILFPRNLSAELYDLWNPPQIMEDCARWRGMNDENIYSTWNGGQGALLVVDENDAESVIEEALQHSLRAKVCGRITAESSPRLVIQSKFSGKEIIYRKN